jgi:5''/3''-nucleotidase SurE
MRILIVNDDGIHARGILTLAKKLSQKHEVTVVAPDSERSATSHSITIYRPLRVREAALSGLEGVACYTIDGLPADCTKIGVAYVMKSGIDLVVAGINHGPNMGSDVLYSGTVAAAMDAALMGYNALAVSCCNACPAHLETAAEIASRVVDSGIFGEKPYDVLYNLNVPDLPLEQIKGIKAVRQSRMMSIDEADVRSDPRGREYVWLASRFTEERSDEETDVTAISEGFAAITPMHFNLTEMQRMPELICRMEKIKLHI